MRLDNRAGFTLIELLTVMVVMAILATVASSTYFRYIDKARITVAMSALDSTNKALEIYNLDHGNYPENIDFNTCFDNNGRQIMSPPLCAELKTSFHRIDSYTRIGNDYRIRATIKNKDLTPVYAAPGKVSTQEIP